MFPLLNAALKGIIEGFTEFLPISSTGHLILFRNLLPLTADPARAELLDNLFDVVVQLPAILAIVVLYRQRLWASASRVLEADRPRRFWMSVVVAFLPAGVVGYLTKDHLDALMKPGIVGIALLLGGIVILVMERAKMKETVTEAEDVSLRQALLIGAVQCISMVPGTSRSAATIIGARLGGLSRTAAAEFSFFLALPTMLGAFTLKFAKSYKLIEWATDGPVLLVGSIFSFVTAWIVVALFIRFLQKHSLQAFGWYRIALGLLVLALL